MENDKETEALSRENAELRARLNEARETLEAIGSGEVDAVLIGDQVYTLQSSDAASNRFRGEVLAQINDVVIALDGDDRVVYMNPSAERQYDVRSSDVLGKKVSWLYERRWPSEEAKRTADAELEKNRFWRGETVHVTHSGKEIDVESIVSRLDHLDGSSAGHLAVIRDISDRKLAERELQQAHEQLEQRVIERTKELADANAALQVEIKERVKTEKERQDLVRKLVTMQEDERSRIARDIHDQLGQRVTALRLQIASMLGQEDLGDLTPRLKRLQETALALDSEVGSLAWELRPTALDDLGLVAAADAFLRDWSREFDLKVQFNARGIQADRLDPDVETHLYRIMQESLNNIVKHARATQVNVLLERRGKTASLIVEDNGKGFDPGKTKRKSGKLKGVGLMGMQERAALVGGKLQIESAKGSGTTVFASVPCSISA